MKLTRKLKAIGKRVKPMGDRLLIKKLEYKHPTLAVVGISLEKGVVVAAGPGRRQRRKVKFQLKEGMDHRAMYFEDGDETGKMHPMRVKVGDVVEFSFRNQVPWRVDGEELVWIREQACYGTTTDSQSAALLWQASAGTDRHGNYLPTEGH